jgi:hypothetical protein
MMGVSADIEHSALRVESGPAPDRRDFTDGDLPPFRMLLGRLKGKSASLRFFGT